MQKIAVTGGSGKAGAAIIADLLEAGYEVMNIDRYQPPFEPPNWPAPFRQCDVTDYGEVLSALQGYDAVIHMASNPHPDKDLHTGAQRFKNNTLCNYNVFNAACALGMKKVVWASSETIHGYPMTDELPEFVPIREADKPIPQNSYAISKLVSEQIAVQFNRLYHIPFVGLRISHIQLEKDFDYIDYFWENPLSRIYNLWGYIYIEDVVQAVRLSLESDLTGAETFYVGAADTIMNRPSRELVETHFPSIKIRDELQGFDNLTSNARAQKVLGYKPEYSWRDFKEAK